MFRSNVPWYVQKAEPGEVDKQRWKYAAHAIAKFMEQKERREWENTLKFLTANVTPPLVAQTSAGLHSTSFYDFYALYDRRSKASFTLLVVTAIYGSTHALAFVQSSDVFPSPLERKLWIIATVVLTVWSVVGAIGATLYWNWKHDWYQDSFIYSLFFLYIVLYFVASLYLMVESLRQLLFLPKEAFDVVDWTTFIPGFS